MWGQQRIFEADETAQDGFDHLRKQERIWFNWVCRLHDVYTDSHSPQSAATLSIARRRWADARRALERAEAGQAD